MSRSSPYNIVVSRSSEAIEKLLFNTRFGKDGTTSARTRRFSINSIERLGRSSDDSRDLADDLIVTPFNNSEFISFETTLPGSGGVKFATLRLLETQRILEKFIIPPDGITDYIARKFRDRVKNLGTLTGEVLSTLKDIKPRYYVSFGVGEDVNKWAGPFILELIDANLTITEAGTREIELGFTPTLETIKIFTNKAFYDKDIVQGKNIFEGQGAKQTELRVESQGLYSLQTVGVNSFPIELSEQNDQGDRWNYAIRSLIRQFLSDRFTSLPDGNVLVLFPEDLDAKGENAPINVEVKGNPLLGRSKDIISLYQTKLNSYGIDIYSPMEQDYNPNEKIDPEKTKIARNSAIKKLERFIANEKKLYLDRSSVFSSRRGTGAGSSPEEQRAARERIQEAEEKIKKIEREVSITRSIAREQLKNTVYELPALEGYVGEIDSLSVERKFAKTLKANPDFNFSTDQYMNIQFVVLAMLSQIEVGDAEDNILESLRPIYKFISQLNSEVDRSIDFTIFEENDLTTTKLLKKHGLIEDGDAPVLVFGDLKVINHLLYEKGEAQGSLEDDLTTTFSVAINAKEFRKKWENFRSDSSRDLDDERGRVGITSSFNEEIDFGPYPDFGQKLTPGTFVFMHNLKNSNVLDISVDSSPYKGELLNLASEPKYKLIQQAIEGDQKIFDNTFKVPVIKDFVDKNFVSLAKQEKYKELIDAGKMDLSDKLTGKSSLQEIFEVLRTDKAFIKSLKDPAVSSISVVDFIDLVRYEFLSRDNKSITQQVRGDRITKSNADIIRKINSFVFSIQLRTLPFFNTNYYLNKQCLLVGVPNKVIGSTFNLGETPPPSIFSNVYGIFAYKHVLTPTDAYSEFTLYQNGITPTSSVDLTLGEFFLLELEALEAKNKNNKP